MSLEKHFEDHFEGIELSKIDWNNFEEKIKDVYSDEYKVLHFNVSSTRRGG